MPRAGLTKALAALLAFAVVAGTVWETTLAAQKPAPAAKKRAAKKVTDTNGTAGYHA